MTNSDITAAYYGVNPVSKIYLGDELVWPTTPPDPYLSMPLTFEILSAGTIVWRKRTIQAANKSIMYSMDGDTWTTITASNTAGTSFNVSAGDIVQFRGANNSYATSSVASVYFSGSTAVFNVYGNIMSLIYSTNYSTKTSFPISTSYNFCYMFGGTNIKSAENLRLPATSLADSCYQDMFRKSTIETAPELPANILAAGCYATMFADCTSLNNIRCLATNISATDCTSGWVTNVPGSVGTFVKHPNMSSWTRGVNGIPTGWTVEDATI